MTDTNSTSFQVDEFYLDLQKEGNRVTMLSQQEIARRPFPGLRPFKTSEFQLYKGRVKQTEELIKRLSNNRFLAVIGSSGTGKSSLVRAGLIPQLFGGYLHEAGSKWDIAICRPGKDPVENLTVALASILSHNETSKELRENFERFEPLLSNSVFGLLDAKELLNKEKDQQNPEKPANLLVIIDQFEELFRFDRKDLGKENIENQFVNLLLKAAKDTRNPIYVIITMRSEFLGDSVKYRGLPEAINEGQYLVPQLTRDDLKEVIQIPISMAGKNISPSLVELLINEIEESKIKDNLDQLPILQHALMRTYEEAMKEGPDTLIDYKHYEAIGEMEHALARHAESIFKELSDEKQDQINSLEKWGDPHDENDNLKSSGAGISSKEQKPLSKKQQIAKLVFQSLTDMGSNQKGGRRPTELKNIHAIAAALKVTPVEVDEVINRFRHVDTSFIMPPRNTELKPNLIIDISHESLMRNWTLLNNWILEEKKAGSLYEQLSERRELHEHDPGDWLRGLLLNEMLDWKKEHPDSSTWASRYQKLPEGSNDDDLVMHKTLYDKNLAFLEGSRLFGEKQAEEKRKETRERILREQKEQSNKKRNLVLSIAAVISLLFAGLAGVGFMNAKQQTKIAREQTIIANQKTELANSKTAEAEKERLNVLVQKGIADSTTDVAMEQRDIAERLRKEAIEQKKLMEKKNILLAKYTKQALDDKRFTDKQNKEFQQQLVVNILKEQPFYFSDLDPAIKEEIIDAVLLEPLSALDESLIPLEKYTNTNLLRYCNELADIKESFNYDPAESMTLLEQIWAGNQHPIVKQLILDIINEHVIAKESVAVAPFINLEEVNSAVARDGQGFIFSTAKRVITGSGKKDKLLIDEKSFDNQLSWIECKMKQNFSGPSAISAITYTKDNHIEMLIDSIKIKVNPGGMVSNQVDTLFMLPREIASIQISPDQHHAFILDQKGNALIWTNAGTQQKIDTIGNYRSNNIQGFFSPNGQHFFLNVNGEARMIETDKKKEIGITNWDEERIKAAAFTPDGKNIIVLYKDTLSIRDSSLSPKKGYTDIYLAKLFLSASITSEEVTSISTSPNLKKILITVNHGVFLLEETNGGTLFSEISYNFYQYRLKPLEYEGRTMKAIFYNDSTILSIDQQGLVSLWPLYSNFSDPETAFSNLGQKKTVTQKLDEKEISYRKLLASAGNTELNMAAGKCARKFTYSMIIKYNRGKEYLDTLELIYRKLNDQAPDEMRAFYLSKLIEITNNRMVIDQKNINPSGTNRDYDTVYRYRSARVKRLKEKIALIQQQVDFCPLNQTYRENLSTWYGSLSYSQLYLQDYNAVIASAKSGLSFSPEKNDWIYTNLALGYLLSGQYKLAAEIYTRYKDKKMVSDKRKDFRSEFLEDIAALENAGVFKNLNSNIISDISTIKNMLKTPSSIK